VPNSKLDTFFSEVDKNNDGTISFEEWRYVKTVGVAWSLSVVCSDDLCHRYDSLKIPSLTSSTCFHSFTDLNESDFLLFIPATAPNLLAVMSYFQQSMKMNAEGDAAISDDTIQGLGTKQRFLENFFGSLFIIAKSPPHSFSSTEHISSFEMSAPSPMSSSVVSQTLPPHSEVSDVYTPLADAHWDLLSVKSVLIACVPNPGYFVAGGLAGIVSRTSTAPLDRLKVYLIAQTSVTKEAVSAAKSGNIIVAVQDAWRPLSTAMKELWHAGGMRSLYAGKSTTSPLKRDHS
jgi:solute carrier family 25 phosphate transporter 23/24/25/41